jgi:predicted nucleic acid-binding protein
VSVYSLDTAFVLALEFANDQNRVAAKQCADELQAHGDHVITTSYVFDEVVTHLNARGHHAKAVQVGQRLMASPDIELVQVGQALFDGGWNYFVQHQDKRYSLTDCISFFLMQQRGLR